MTQGEPDEADRIEAALDRIASQTGGGNAVLSDGEAARRLAERLDRLIADLRAALGPERLT